MKKNDKIQLHTLEIAELQTQLKSAQSELSKARLEHKVGKLTNPSKLTHLRKSLARITTVLSEKTRAATA